jgi:hypothetical protein
VSSENFVKDAVQIFQNGEQSVVVKLGVMNKARTAVQREKRVGCTGLIHNAQLPSLRSWVYLDIFTMIGSFFREICERGQG